MNFKDMFQNKTDKKTINYMVNHFNPNDNITFDEELLKRDPEYRKLERKHREDMIKWNYYKLYIEMFCGRNADAKDVKDIESSKKFGIRYIGIMEDIIQYKYHDKMTLDIFREHRGLIDGKEKSYQEIHDKLQTLFPAGSYAAIDIPTYYDIKDSGMWTYSEYVGYCEPKSEDFNQTLEQCNDTIKREILYYKLSKEQEGGKRM